MFDDPVSAQLFCDHDCVGRRLLGRDIDAFTFGSSKHGENRVHVGAILFRTSFCKSITFLLHVRFCACMCILFVHVHVCSVITYEYTCTQLYYLHVHLYAHVQCTCTWTRRYVYMLHISSCSAVEFLLFLRCFFLKLTFSYTCKCVCM